MNWKELKELVLEGESAHLEFKRKVSTPEKIAKEICAFANTVGGTLLIGVDDDGAIVGVPSDKGDEEIIDKVCNFLIEPPVRYYLEIVDVGKKDVIVVKIPRSAGRPHKVIIDDDKPNAQAYIRIGEKSVVASHEMTKILASQRADVKPLKISIGDKEKRLFDYLARHEKATVQDFARLVNISNRRAGRLLVRLVRAGVIQIHIETDSDYYTLVDVIK
jgi:predicted HTH transcriptional regulator